jgi:hypothetical protein
MRLNSRKICMFVSLLAALCFFSAKSAHAQTLYLGVEESPSVITLGQTVTLTANCNPGASGYPGISYYVSSTPNTLGSEIGGGRETTWTPSVAGTYYISASFTYEGNEGQPTCQSNDTIPVYSELVVNP